jgi:glycerol-3-phosphate dehydrogenase
LLSAYKDKRMLFVIPRGQTTLIGTTDTDYAGSADKVYATSEEVKYLLDEIRRIFPAENINKKDIITTYAGLRPLVNTQNKLTWHVSREHIIKESNSGLISVVGGKYTTYRHLAEQVVDVALSKLGGRSFKECVTKTIGPNFQRQKNLDMRQSVERAVTGEMANSLCDLLLRRLRLSAKFLLGPKLLDEYANIMAELLGWSKSEKKSQRGLYEEEIRKNTAWKKS